MAADPHDPTHNALVGALRQALEAWEIEVCARCRQLTEYDRDYGGPFPQGKCPHEDCPTNSDDWYATCPGVETIKVARADLVPRAEVERLKRDQQTYADTYARNMERVRAELDRAVRERDEYNRLYNKVRQDRVEVESDLAACREALEDIVGFKGGGDYPYEVAREALARITEEKP